MADGYFITPAQNEVIEDVFDLVNRPADATVNEEGFIDDYAEFYYAVLTADLASPADKDNPTTAAANVFMPKTDDTMEDTGSSITIVNRFTSYSASTGDLILIYWKHGEFIPLATASSDCCCADPLTDATDIDEHPHLPPSGDRSAYGSRLIVNKCDGGKLKAMSVQTDDGGTLTWTPSADVLLTYSAAEQAFIYTIPVGELSKVDATAAPVAVSEAATVTETWAAQEVIINLENMRFRFGLLGRIPAGRYSNSYVRFEDPPNSVQPNCELCSNPVKQAIAAGCPAAPNVSSTISLSYTAGDFSFITSEVLAFSQTGDYTNGPETRVGDILELETGLWGPDTSYLTGSETLEHKDCQWCGGSQRQLDTQYMEPIFDYSTIPAGCGIQNRTFACQEPYTIFSGTNIWKRAQTTNVDLVAEGLHACDIPLSRTNTTHTQVSQVVPGNFGNTTEISSEATWNCFLKWTLGISHITTVATPFWSVRLTLSMQYQKSGVKLTDFVDPAWAVSAEGKFPDVLDGFNVFGPNTNLSSPPLRDQYLSARTQELWTQPGNNDSNITPTTLVNALNYSIDWFGSTTTEPAAATVLPLTISSLFASEQASPYFFQGYAPELCTSAPTTITVTL